MKLRQLSLCIVLLIALQAIVPIANGQGSEEVKIAETKLAEGIYMLTGMGGNLGLMIGEQAIFLIDDQYANINPQIMNKISELSGSEINGSDIFLLNTHFHGDHTGGNELIGGIGATILAHENVRERLAVEQNVPFFGSSHAALSTDGLPVLTFDNDITLHLNGETIEISYVGPAHTDGDAIVHFRKANIIHAGDIAFIGTYPFVDLDNGGTFEGMFKACQTIISLCDDNTQVIPGHGPMTDKAGMTAYLTMLTATYESVKALVEQVKSLEEIVESKPTAKFDSVWEGFINAESFVGLLYRDLTK